MIRLACILVRAAVELKALDTLLQIDQSVVRLRKLVNATEARLDALEAANAAVYASWRNLPSSSSGQASASGYLCPCGTWVTWGKHHSCSQGNVA